MNYDRGILGDSCSYTARDPVQGTTISGTARVTPRPVYRARGGRQSVCFFSIIPMYRNNITIIIIIIITIMIAVIVQL